MKAKLLFLFLLVLTSVPSQVFGQQEKPAQKTVAEDKKKEIEAEKERKLQRELEIRSLVLAAKAQSAEVAADVLFVVLEKEVVSDSKERQDLIEYIFRLAPEAKEPFRVSSPGSNVDTRTGYRLVAAEQKLDQLSIQLRAVKMMLPLDQVRARKLFSDIVLKLEPLSCEDALNYEVSDFYSGLIEIVDQTFDAESRLRNEPTYFAASYLDSIDSPMQIVPAIDFLFKVKTTPEQFEILIDSFTTSLRKMKANARGFAFSTKYSLTALMKYLSQRNTDSKSARSRDLLRAYRTYLVKNLSGTQCSDSLVTGTKEKPNSMIEAANQLFESPLTEDDIKPEKIEPGMKVFEYWKNVKTAKLLRNIKELRFGSSQETLSLEERNKPEWQQKLMKFLEQMNEWKPEDEETEADYLHQRCVLYRGLIDLTPPGPMLSSILQNYALYLRDSKMQKESPLQWLNYVKFLMKIGKNNLKGKDYDNFINILGSSGHPVFQLYIDLERLQSAPTTSSKEAVPAR